MRSGSILIEERDREREEEEGGEGMGQLINCATKLFIMKWIRWHRKRKKERNEI